MRHYKKSFGLAVAIVVVVAAVCFERSRLANCATSSRVSPKRNFVASLVEALNDNDDATAWLNLGLWPETDVAGIDSQFRVTYPEAAEALAMKVAAAARLSHKGAVVVDVGCGLGESLLLWQRKFDVAASSIGVNRDASEVAAAHTRGALNVIQGDATQLPMANSTADVVLAVDSAYHFYTRAAFLIDASRVLKPGGTFAAVDIVVASDGNVVEGSLVSHTWQRQLVCKLVGIPLANMYTSNGYRAVLKDAGLSDSITIDDVTTSVIGGFSSGDWTDNTLIRAIAWLLGAMMHHANLRFVIVAATKPG